VVDPLVQYEEALNREMIEIPYQTYIRKMPKDDIITDEE